MRELVLLKKEHTDRTPVSIGVSPVKTKPKESA